MAHNKEDRFQPAHAWYHTSFANGIPAKGLYSIAACPCKAVTYGEAKEIPGKGIRFVRVWTEGATQKSRCGFTGRTPA